MNVCLMHTEQGSQLAIRFAAQTASANFDNLRFRQFGSWISLAFYMSAVFLIISTVFFRGSPSKIRNAVIGGIAVQMSSLASLWAWSGKSLKHETMYPERLVFAVGRTEVDITVSSPDSSLSLNSWNQLTPCLNEPSSCVHSRPYASVAANAVAGKTFNVSVFDRISGSHDSQLLPSWVSWLGHSWRPTVANACFYSTDNTPTFTVRPANPFRVTLANNPPSRYQALKAEALRDGVPLVLFIGCPPRELWKVLAAHFDGPPADGLPMRCIVVAVPRNGAMEWVASLEPDAEDDDILIRAGVLKRIPATRLALRSAATC